MKHPPLCPKTKDVFDPGGWLSCYIGADTTIEEHFVAHRRFLARYQACAWQDRADRWDAVACRTDNDDYRWRAAADELHRCEDIARAWRAWEREETT